MFEFTLSLTYHVECAQITLWSSTKSRCHHDIVKFIVIPTMYLVLHRKRSFGYRLVNRQVTKRRWTALEVLMAICLYVCMILLWFFFEYNIYCNRQKYCSFDKLQTCDVSCDSICSRVESSFLFSLCKMSK